MTPREIVDTYYTLANGGEWDRWSDLFAAGAVVDEQLAGRIEGRETLRAAVKGFPELYRRFTNTPRHVLVDGEQAAVISHISAVTPDGRRIEADVANYFRFEGGLIAYMANFHDSVPFTGGAT
ncbi:nuclear transport factor 2 family protein [Nonomuraea sp. LPB2021202275-12-8]|uniref:nuclear transport factor 2 family protein n=1 Tax=Nonomuraea sp. LPB2021202275-12-8 TaxID=3120159 RepID=UPI00300DA456